MFPSQKAQALDSKNIKNISDMRRARPEVIEEACAKKSGNRFGKRITDFARTLPDFEITGEITKELIRTDGVGVTVAWTVYLKNVETVRLTTKKGSKKLTASILVTTSDNVSPAICLLLSQLTGTLFPQQWVEYKRAKIATMQSDNNGKGVLVKKTVVLTKPSQKIECYVSCDEFGKRRAS